MRKPILLALAFVLAAAVPLAAWAEDDCQGKGAEVAAAEKAQAEATDAMDKALDKLTIANERARAAERAFDEARRKVGADQKAWKAAVARGHACMASHRGSWKKACAADIQKARDAFATLEADRSRMDSMALEIGSSEMDADAARKEWEAAVKAVEKAISRGEAARDANAGCEEPPTSPPERKHA
jgi:chromosome segregation ATPase